MPYGKITQNELDESLLKLISGTTYYKSSSTISSASNKVLIKLPYDKDTDLLIPFKNTTYLSDYGISDDEKYITNTSGNWDTENTNMVFNFLLIKNMPNHYTHSTVINTAANQVAIGIDNFNKDTDVLIVFQGSTFISDYGISIDSKNITNTSGNWNNDNLTEQFDFICIKDMKDKFFEYSNTITADTNQIAISIPTFNKLTDLLIVFKNRTYLDGYNISDDSQYIINPTGNWHVDVSMTFNFLMIKDIKNENTLSEGSIDITYLSEQIQNVINKIENKQISISDIVDFPKGNTVGGHQFFIEATDPATITGYVPQPKDVWLDTTNGIFKQRNASNSWDGIGAVYKQ